ncbi:MAG: FecR family protein, partial [Parabacteroides sp.]
MEKETLYRFFDGRASKEEKEEVRLWLNDSREHEKELFREREFFDATILSENVSPREEKKESERLFVRMALREFLKVAVVVAIMLIGSVYFYQSRMAKLALTMNTVTAPAGQRVNLTLPDGTKVWLNARSEIQYPAVFIGSIRRVKLTGEAYFEVKHDKSNPFIVQTKKCNIKVLGTKFN